MLQDKRYLSLSMILGKAHKSNALGNITHTIIVNIMSMCNNGEYLV